MKNVLVALFSLTILMGNYGISQKTESKEDSLMLRKIYNESLLRGKAYDDLYVLCKDIGPRLAGSVGAEKAVEWGVKTLGKYNFDTIYTEEVMVPHWVRGAKEKAYLIDSKNNTKPLNILALGGSEGTNGVLTGKVKMFKTLDALKSAKKEEVEGKIVFVAEHMEQTFISAYHAYGFSGKIRWSSPSEASRKGAIAVITRTLSLSENDFPNSGVIGYAEDVKRIPAATLSTNDATALEKLIDAGEEVFISLQMDCQTLPDVPSHNVIAEMKGSVYPSEIITVGGHLDSWDVSEGAHDDGAGIVHTMEALRLLQEVKYTPKRTLRVVFFMNEENGSRGAKEHAKRVAEKNEKVIYAIESDLGGFTPRGFDIDGSDEKIQFIQRFAPLFKPYFIHHFEKGYSGVDVGHLKEKDENVTALGFVPDSQRYFDIHHNANDVFENINKRELQLGAATIGSLVYLLDKHTK